MLQALVAGLLCRWYCCASVLVSMCESVALVVREWVLLHLYLLLLCASFVVRARCMPRHLLLPGNIFVLVFVATIVACLYPCQILAYVTKNWDS